MIIVKNMTRYPRTFLTISLLAVAVFFIVRCTGKSDVASGPITDKKGHAFAGSQTCANCHKDIYQKHLQTAHYLTTREARAEFIKGSFETGKNAYYYNKSVVVAMEQRADSFYQVEYFRDQEKKRRPFQIVVGSGTMGQSYLYWSDHKLFQLPITFFIK